MNLVTPTHGSDNDLSPHWFNIVNLVTPNMVLTMIFLRTGSIL